MLYKFKRHKYRESFAIDKIFKCLSVNKFSETGSRVFTTHKYLSKYFDDDHFCNMLVHWHEFKISKLSSIRAKRLYPFYPTYTPMAELGIILSKSEVYNIKKTWDYNCVHCGAEIKSYFGERTMKNFLCSECISNNFLNARGLFVYRKSTKELYGEKYSKNLLDFFKDEKEREHRILVKILKRQEFYSKSLCNNKQERSKVIGIYRSLKNNLSY